MGVHVYSYTHEHAHTHPLHLAHTEHGIQLVNTTFPTSLGSSQTHSWTSQNSGLVLILGMKHNGTFELINQ